MPRNTPGLHTHSYSRPLPSPARRPPTSTLCRTQAGNTSCVFAQVVPTTFQNPRLPSRPTDITIPLNIAGWRERGRPQTRTLRLDVKIKEPAAERPPGGLVSDLGVSKLNEYSNINLLSCLNLREIHREWLGWSGGCVVWVAIVLNSGRLPVCSWRAVMG